MTDIPRIRRNDYGILEPPPLGEWTPTLSVSVVIPGHGSQDKLDLTLASLAAQSYPAHLLEVIVVDDGSVPPLRLAEIQPIRTRLVSSPADGWGAGRARNHGAELADGQVVHWLDADMLLYHRHVEALMRWHHLADYLVVLGYKRFVDYTLGGLSATEVFDAVSADDAGKLYSTAASTSHDWFEEYVDMTNGLRDSGPGAWRVHVGATSSLPADLLRAVGGMDPELVRGQDSEVGYRLVQAGAVIVPEPDARSWHLGQTMIMRRRAESKRFSRPHVAQAIPLELYRGSFGNGRQWRVPYVDVVIDAREASSDDVKVTVDGLLGGTLTDIAITLIGAWSSLSEERRNVLDEPQLDIRLMRADYQKDGRVRLVEESLAELPASPFRFTCPPGYTPSVDALQRVVDMAEENMYGSVVLLLGDQPDLVTARLDRTAAVARARLLGASDDDLDYVIDEVYGTHWIDGSHRYVNSSAEDAVPLASFQEWVTAVRDLVDEKEQLAADLEAARARVKQLEARLKIGWAGRPLYRRALGRARRLLRSSLRRKV